MTQKDSYHPYLTFITDVLTDGKIYTLSGEDGELVYSYSKEFVDENEEPFLLQPLWSSSSLLNLQANQVGDWQDTTILEISVSELLNSVLDELDRAGFLIGTNLNQNLLGTECPADILKKHLIMTQEIKRIDQTTFVRDLENL